MFPSITAAEKKGVLTILNDYRQADPEASLNHFLLHRELRGEFSEIENDEYISLKGNKRGFNLTRKNKKRLTFPFEGLKKRYRPAG